ncbi:MAG: hypothetical protein IPK14_14615 [Blastocatellia bacterium]|nr:hypothetical protein [Blastocatellia bacterium]
MAKDDKSKSRGLFWLGIGLLAGVGLGGAYAWRKTSERYKPKTTGGFKLAGLNSLVEVWRDIRVYRISTHKMSMIYFMHKVLFKLKTVFGKWNCTDGLD